MGASILWIVSYIATGLTTGLISGITGLGGGIITVTALTHIFYLKHYPIDAGYRMSLATSAVLTLMGSISNAYFHFKNKNLNWGLVKKYIAFIITGSIIGALASHTMPVKALKVIFVVICIATITKMFLHTTKQQQENNSELNTSKIFYLFYWLSGFISALVSIGGGVIYVPLLSAQRTAMTRAVGTASLFVLTTALGTTVGHALIKVDERNLNLINFPILIYVGIPILIGTKIGTSLIHKISTEWIKTIFLTVVILSATKMAYSI